LIDLHLFQLTEIDITDVDVVIVVVECERCACSSSSPSSRQHGSTTTRRTTAVTIEQRTQVVIDVDRCNNIGVNNCRNAQQQSRLSTRNNQQQRQIVQDQHTPDISRFVDDDIERHSTSRRHTRSKANDGCCRSSTVVNTHAA
jgi:hypothetical protein